MKCIKQLIYLSVFFLFLSTITYPTDHYVDNTVSSSGNGLSWGTAWKNFSDIHWSSIQPGDIVYISGGTDSTVYNEQLQIHASGNAQFPITIRNSYESGHNGRVIINPNNYSTDAIQIGWSSSNHPDYIYLKGLETKHSNHGIQIRWACEVITLDSLIMTDMQERGIRISGIGYPNPITEGYCADSITVKNCTIITPVNIATQTDCIYWQWCTNIFIENNYMHTRNLSPVNNHSDVIQSNLSSGDLRIVDNILICDSNAQGMPIIIGHVDSGGDTAVIYNNYCYMGGIWRDGAPWVSVVNNAYNSYYWDYSDDYPVLIIAHNTFVSNGPYVAGCHIETPATIVNNIYAQFGDAVGFGGESGYWLATTRSSSFSSESSYPWTYTQVDSMRNNLMWSEWRVDTYKNQGYFTKPDGTVSQCYTWDDWVNDLGGSGVSANPLFVKNIGNEANQGTLNGELEPGSPAINAGEDIGWLIESLGLPWADIRGVPRDNTPTIGAYEYTTGGGGNSPPNQPSNPSPANGAIDKTINLTITWSCTDPDGDQLTYDIYFGTGNNPPLVSGNQSNVSYNPGQLNNNTTYYWKIVAKDNQGATTSGPIWNFSTEVVGGDTTSPELVNAILINTTTLELIFTEPVDSVSALYLSNYTISNDINIEDALISNYKDVVTLITDNHTNGITYTVSANNIYDLSGNLISEQHKSKDYTCITDSVAPELTDVRFQNNKTLTVNFSERVDYNSASNKNNYSISDNIIINSVQVLPDSSGAMLNTSRQSNNSEYLISVSNIKDRAGNNLNPNPSSKSYLTRRKGKGSSRQNPILMAKSNSWFQYYTPDKTIDGKGMTYPDSRWQSDETMPTDIIFDLGKSQSFDSLRISYHKWETGRMFQFSVYTSRDSVNWIPAVEEIWSENSEWTELNVDSVETRYMKLLLVKSNQGPFASIWEVEMYGTENNSSGEEIKTVPNSFKLSQNFPNPFNPATNIRYSVPQPSQIQIKIYDVLGNEIQTLIDEFKQIGNYEIEYSAVNLPSGIYFYKLQSATFIETKKMVLMK